MPLGPDVVERPPVWVCYGVGLNRGESGACQLYGPKELPNVWMSDLPNTTSKAAGKCPVGKTPHMSFRQA